MILRGIVGSLCYLFLLIPLQLIPMSEHQAIFYTSPIFVGILGYFILNEPYHLKIFLSALISFFGLILIVKP